MSDSILITGGCGFAGSFLALNLKKDFPSSRIVCLDNLRRRGSELNIPRLKEFDIEFIHGDVRNKEDLLESGDITLLIDAAAEPSVLSGINSTPEYVINSNLNGTINCLNYAVAQKAKFIFLSTSRVYPIEALSNILFSESEKRFNIHKEQTAEGVSQAGINENFSLSGARSFYGASKLSAEYFVQEYSQFYGLKSIINRCGVLTGPWQMGKADQGVIVLWLASHFWKKELSYIGFGGKGKQVRDILHIADLYKLIKSQISFFDDYTKTVFNVGGGIDSSVSLCELTALCEEITGNRIKINSVSENRQADIPIYVTDNSKINGVQNWSPEFTIKETLTDTFNWIKSNENSLKQIFI